MAEPYDQDGDEGSTVEFRFAPEEINAGSTGDFGYKVEVGDASATRDLDAEVKAFLYVNGEDDSRIVDSENTISSENETVEGILSHTFETNSNRNEAIQDNRTGPNATSNPRDEETGYPRIDDPVWIKVTIDFYDDSPGFARGNVDETLSTVRLERSDGKTGVRVLNPFDEPSGGDAGGEVGGDDTLSGVFADRTPFSVKEIQYEDDASYVSSVYSDDEQNNNGFQISFDYPNPTVAIDTAGRFAKHEILGGSTVRQKIGEDPVNISVTGVCKRRTANQIDSLRDARTAKLYSDRLPGENDALRVHIGSTSTEPMTDGGSADLRDGEYLYSFTINAIEVIR